VSAAERSCSAGAGDQHPTCAVRVHLENYAIPRSAATGGRFARQESLIRSMAASRSYLTHSEPFLARTDHPSESSIVQRNFKTKQEPSPF